jgi:hypothetical protein
VIPSKTEVRALLEEQAGAIAEHQCGAALQTADVLEEAADFFRVERDGKLAEGGAPGTAPRHCLPQGISRVTR